MTFLTSHPNIENCYIWRFDPKGGWNDFNLALDEISEFALRADEPFCVLLFSQGDTPKGNPFSYIKRMLRIIETNDMLVRIVGLLATDHIIAQHFARLMTTMMNLDGLITVVRTEADGEEVAREVLAEAQKSLN